MSATDSHDEVKPEIKEEIKEETQWSNDSNEQDSGTIDIDKREISLDTKWFDCDRSEPEDLTQIPDSFNTDTVYRLRCSKCEYRCVNQYHLRRHMIDKHRLEGGTKWLHCRKCDFKGKNKRSLTTHMKSTHHRSTPKRKHPLQCPHCGQEFRSISSQKRHVLVTHMDEVQWVHCDQCDFKSYAKNNVKIHARRMHRNADEIKLVYCDQCEFKGRSDSMLRMHLSKMHKSKSVVEYECDKCTYKSQSKGHLSLHKRTHDPEVKLFECNYCDFKSIVSEGNLAKHLVKKHANRGVEEIALFSCKDCEVKFKTQLEVKLHRIREHPLLREESEWLQCKKCVFRCLVEEELTRHIRRKHLF